MPTKRPPKNPVTLPTRYEPRFLDNADGRQIAVREIKRRLNRLIEDHDINGFAKEELARRAIFISVQLETMETNAVERGEFDAGVYTQMVNALSGLLTKLGLERKAKDVVDLDVYLARGAK